MMKLSGLICALTGAAALFGQEPVILSFAGGTQPAYQALLNRLKVDGSEIDSASPDAGIQTKVVRNGKKPKQSASYMKFTFIPDGEHTRIRIAVYETHRVNIPLVLQAWSDPVVSPEASKAEAFTLKNELGW
jgi:hypothetical protein